MGSVGGSIESVTLDGRTFSVAADADSQRKAGGFENEVQSNGDGTARLIKTRVPWSVSDLTISIDDQNNDHAFLQALSDRKAFFPITVSYASGAVFNGSGQISGELAVGSTNTTAALSLAGSGTYTQQ